MKRPKLTEVIRTGARARMADQVNMINALREGGGGDGTHG